MGGLEPLECLTRTLPGHVNLSIQVKSTSKMKVPPTFNLESLLPPNNDIPPPRKSRMRKTDLYDSPNKFRAVDDHVTKVSGVNHRSFRGFIWHLLHSSQHVRTDLEKVRAIYRWMTTKNRPQQIFENKAGQNTAEFLVSEFQRARASHAQVFKLFCLFSGLHCKIIVGHAKGKDYRPGEPCSQERFRHCWNAVLLNGNWFLIDCKWGTRSSKTDEQTSEYYFLSDPDQLLLSHLSEDTTWQLVDRPITMNEFENLPFVKPHFYACGLHFVSNMKCVMETKRGHVRWEIGTKSPVKFSHRMTCAETGSDHLNGQQLRKFIYHDVQSGRGTFALRSPTPGIYFLKLFARSIQENAPRDARLHEVLEYKVQIDNACIEDDPLPDCWDNTWGPTDRTERMCLYPTQKRGSIKTEDKSIRLEVNKTRPVNVFCRLLRNGWREDMLQKCVKLQDNDMKAYIEVKLPLSGEYGVEIFGCFPNKEDKTYKHVCQYLVTCQRHDDDVSESFIESFLLPSQTKTQQKVEKQEVTMNGEVFVDASDNTEAPPSFRITPLPDDDDSLPPPRPTEAEVQVRKYSIPDIEQHVQSVDDEKDVDIEEWTDEDDESSDEKSGEFSKPILVREHKHLTLRDLLWNLIYSRRIQDSLTKARVLFMWLATIKPQDVTFDSVDAGSPEESLRGLGSGRTTYAMAFHTLSKYSDLHSKVITGVAKGMDYKPGQPLVPGSNHHTWNVVLIGGVWHFVDTRFARRPVISNLTNSSKVQYELDDHFFMTNPEQFIYTHFPDDPQWQLLDPHVTMEEFCNMPVMTPHFFALGLDVCSHRKADVVSKGETEIVLKYPHQKVFHFTFSVHAGNGSEDFQGTKLNRYGMLEAHNGFVTFRLRLPNVDSYAFFVYAKEEMTTKSDSMFAQVCEYRIIQENVSSPPSIPYPPCAYQSWGPGVAFHQFGLKTASVRSIIKTTNGMASVEVVSPKTMQFRTRLVQHGEKAEFEGYVTCRLQDLTTVFVVTSPGKGEFGLEIYAKDPDTETKKMRHVAQYLILCEEEVQTVQLPRLPSGFLGPQPMLLKYGVAAVSHPDPVIHADSNNLEIKFSTSQNMRFTTSLSETESKRDCSDYVFIQSENSGITLLLTLPNSGFFTLCVHGNPFTDNSQQIPGLFNYLIHCKNTVKEALAYPKQYGFWKEGCSMLQPLTIEPSLHTVLVPFKVRVPRAATVAVVVNKDWTALSLGEDGVWEGEIQLEGNQEPTKIVLVASYGDDELRFATLLEYNIE
ncbi:hypothetical protein FSP39_009493 [Pinctada imbricata]|uniref:Transglutaminase-like domain-containing protein n=1 Tax=Pinctada imbricata TaxID=66713 RepID=A0AA88Y329_PINIB|nr:hypothetical protein FSP39_009493 [Pinctada imbricata]